MKILIISETFLPEKNGVSIGMNYRLKNFSDFGHEVKIVVPDFSPLGDDDRHKEQYKYIGEIFPNVNVSIYPTKKVMPLFVGLKKFAFKKIKDEIINFKPDVVYVTSPDRFVFFSYIRPAVKLCRKYNILAAAFWHTNFSKYMDDYSKDFFIFKFEFIKKILRKLIVWCYNSYDITMVTSKITQKYIKELGISNTIQDIFHGVDIEDFSKTKETKTNLFPKLKDENKVRVIYIGRTDREKSIDILLKAFDLVRKQTNTCNFILIGCGMEDKKIEKWVSENEDAEFLGSKSNEELYKYYSSADIFITASKTETFGLTVLEAMACQLPVIGANAGGVSEIVKSNDTGILVEPDNIEGFANAIIKLSNNKSLRELMGKKGVEEAKKYTWQNAVKNMIKCWEEKRNSQIQ